jgi:hypothetical protein
MGVPRFNHATRSFRICYLFIVGGVLETIAAQAIAVTARNFLARRGSKMDFLAPTPCGHRFARKLLTAGFARF